MTLWEIVIIQDGIQKCILKVRREHQPTETTVTYLIRDTPVRKLGGLDVSREYEYVVQK